MRLKDYGRNVKKRKEYVQQPSLLLVGIDVSNAKQDACIGTQSGVIQSQMPPCSDCHGIIRDLLVCPGEDIMVRSSFILYPSQIAMPKA